LHFCVQHIILFFFPKFSTDFHEFRTLLDRWEENFVELATSPAVAAIKPDPRTGQQSMNGLMLAADEWTYKKV
jgi:hypothetical protein